MSNFTLTKTEQMKAARRSAAKCSAASKLRIEGEYLTRREIAVRTGLTLTQVHKRLSELRAASGPITLARIAA